MVSQQLKKQKVDPWSARLYQGAWAEAEAEREVGSGVQRVSRGVSILLIEFHEWQATFQIFFQYKTLKTELLELVFFKDNFHVHFLTFHGHNFWFFSRILF